MHSPTHHHRPDLGFTAGDTLLVTGVASGIGRSIALHAARMGLRISAWDLHADGLESLAAEIADAGGEAMTMVADVSDETAVAEGFRHLGDTFGVARYLANNAGPPSSVPLDFDEALRISVGSMRRMTDTWANSGAPPGAAMVATPRSPATWSAPRAPGIAESETGRSIVSRMPQGRMGAPHEVALAILFLLSPLATYINGICLPVDGGWTVTQ